MAHLIFEYTANLRAEGDIPGLVRKANQVMIAQEVFPVGGIRSRAIELADYCVADGSADDAFVHATVKIGAGRSPEARQKTGDELFEMMKAHFAALYDKRYLALSLELVEFSEAGTWKHNNIHARYRKG
ncbi:5-carboxymethyl-2-hydroxymuconate isomerase [Azoarcus sp. DD4]|uniref:5-carboxymethyl-2-hydroxymuconate Delta-isomerase n=1 Tax=Azoarcus sp. DD4 TaxID=2027405 RepID=UPI001127974F|nr:5-carboxymethyl-2-hydroxymuconate Delta-isomerase [Azoarcus sp. DD4]QDF98046.1 5-carboxymethyl-2-hydroxymuconate isomerase [Azoarcus sp. DD4]